MIVKRVIEKEVNNCPECPYYQIEYGHETIEWCTLRKGYVNYEKSNTGIDKRCPLLNK